MRTRWLTFGGVLCSACIGLNSDFDEVNESEASGSGTSGGFDGGSEAGTENGDSMGDGDSATAGDGDGTTTSGDGDGTTTSGDGDGTTTSGDGDGTTTSGDGDGDSDGTSGDGDGTTTSGDGDGDGTSGDGDGTTTSGDGDGTTTSGDGDGDGTAPDCGSSPVLIACYDFETPTDGVLDDAGPSSLDGVANNIDATAGINGTAGLFGAGSQGLVDHSVEFVTGDLTMAVWVRLDALPTDTAVVMTKVGQMDITVTSAGKVGCSVPLNGGLIGGSVSVGNWFHVACSFDGTLRLYQDGVQRGMTGSGGIVPLSAEPLLFGGEPLGDALVGALDSARVYSASLVAADICWLAGC